MRPRVLASLALLLTTGLSLWPSHAAAEGPCEYRLGFKAIADRMPAVVGGCLENEHFNPANGDSLQQTSRGLLVWRKEDNLTAFTDGYWTWVAGPFGVQQRPNAGPLFDWEAPAAAQESAPPVLPPDATDPATAAPSAVQWKRHDDPEKRFDVPSDWEAVTIRGINFYVSPDREARITYMAPFKMGRDAKAIDFLGRVIDQLAASDAIELGPHSQVSVNGHAGDLQVYVIKSRPAFVGAIVAIQRGSCVHVIDVGATARSWDEHEDVLLHVLSSYVPKQQ